MRQVMQARRPQLAELGVFLLVVALPLVFTPFSASPFGDPKLVVLTAACLCLVASGLSADRRTTMAGAALVIVAALAAAFGVDPAEALTAQTNSDGSGLITVVCIAVVASIGGALPADLRARALRWVVGAAVTVAGLGIASRLVPGPLEDLFPGQGLVGSTMGNQVFAIALVAAALGVLLTSESLSSSRMWWSQLVVLSVGIASFGERSSLAFVVVTGVVGLWRRTDRRRRIGKALVVVALLVLAWQVVAPQLPIPSTLGSQLTSLTSDRARFVSWRVGLESVADRPLLGWGPGSTKSAYLANASPTDIEITTRGVGDAHNLFVGTLVEMGVLGLVAMVVFGGLLATRALPRSNERAAAFTAALVMSASWLVEPTNLVLAPLLFFFLALAGPVSDDVLELPPKRARRALSLTVTVALSVATIVSVQMLAASSLERWGRLYGETWALEGALRIQPWRISSAELLALSWALDGRAGDEAASRRARDLIAGAVEDHPWDGGVRLVAADIETLLRDEAAARAWIDEHLERFPGDAEGVGEAAENDRENPLPGA